jgi:hypothetical protein
MIMRTVKSFAFFLVAAGCFAPLTASAMTWTIDCEGGSPGAKVAAKSMTSFSEAFSKTVYSNAQAASGKQSCQMGVTKGSEGWGEWGGIVNFPTKLSTGDEIWVRLSMYVPSTFKWTSNVDLVKFLRIRTSTSSGGNRGYQDLYVVDPAAASKFTGDKYKSPLPPAFNHIYEGRAVWKYVGQQSQHAMAGDKWETYEMYVKFDSVAKDAKGGGVVRIWKNNQLLLDRTDEGTLVAASDYADSFYLFTFWNGAAPQTQSLYVDDIVLTTDTPANKDANGNACLCGSIPLASAAAAQGAPPAIVGPDAPGSVTVN